MAFSSISISCENLELHKTIDDLWVSLGRSLANRLESCWKPPHPISSRNEFFSAFSAAACPLNIVLLLDEFSDLYSVDGSLRDDFLRGLRDIRTDNEHYGIRSMIAAGIFSIVYLNTTNPTFSPFNSAGHVFNPNFTEDESLKLFRDFALDRQITIDDDVIKDIWLKSDGCVLTLANYLLTHSSLAIRGWFAFVDVQYLTTFDRCVSISALPFKIGKVSLTRFFTMTCLRTTPFVA